MPQIRQGRSSLRVCATGQFLVAKIKVRNHTVTIKPAIFILLAEGRAIMCGSFDILENNFLSRLMRWLQNLCVFINNIIIGFMECVNPAMFVSGLNLMLLSFLQCTGENWGPGWNIEEEIIHENKGCIDYHSVPNVNGGCGLDLLSTRWRPFD
jgi:hypothetical protein